MGILFFCVERQSVGSTNFDLHLGEQQRALQTGAGDRRQMGFQCDEEATAIATATLQQQ